MKKTNTNAMKSLKNLFVLLIVFMLFHRSGSIAQTFDVTSKNNFKLKAVIDTTDIFFDYVVPSTFTNTSPNKTIDSFFVWEKKIISMPSEWRNTICDAQRCLDGNIYSSTFYKGASKSAKLDVGFFAMGVAGSAQVEVMVCPENKKNLAKKFIYTAILEMPTAVYGASAQLVFQKAYPNPSTGNINVELRLAKEVTLTLILKDISGRQVKEIKLNRTLHANTIIDMSDLSSGLYYLQYNIDGIPSKTISISKI